MMLYVDTGELVLEDSPVGESGTEQSGSAVIVDVETGHERGRAPIGAPMIMGMFLCPGFARDFYVATLPGTIARVFVS